jgi:hypothetical protein
LALGTRGNLGKQGPGKGLRILNLADDFCSTHFKSTAQKIACLRGAKFTFDEATRERAAMVGVPKLGKPRRVKIIRER